MRVGGKGKAETCCVVTTHLEILVFTVPPEQCFAHGKHYINVKLTQYYVEQLLCDSYIE